MSELVARHFRRQQWQTKPVYSYAHDIYTWENPSAHRRKFKAVAKHAYALFVAQFGDMPLDEFRHVHINILNVPMNMAFKHLDIYRLSPFRRLYIPGEGDLSRTMSPITVEHLHKVKAL